MSNIDQYFIHIDYRDYLTYGIKQASSGNNEKNQLKPNADLRRTEIKVASEKLKEKWFRNIEAKAMNQKDFTTKLADILNDSIDQSFMKISQKAIREKNNTVKQNVYEQIANFLNETKKANITGQDVATLLGSKNLYTQSNIYKNKKTQELTFEKNEFYKDFSKLYHRIDLMLKTGFINDKRIEELELLQTNIKNFVRTNRKALKSGKVSDDVRREAIELLYKSGQNRLGSKTIGTLAEYIAPFVLLKEGIVRDGIEQSKNDLVKEALFGDKKSTVKYQMSQPAYDMITTFRGEILAEEKKFKGKEKDKKITVKTTPEECDEVGVAEIELEFKNKPLPQKTTIITDVSIEANFVFDETLLGAFRTVSNLDKINISMKNYKNRNTVSLVSTSLLGLLNVGPAEFAAHYFNFIGGHRQKTKNVKGTIKFEEFNRSLSILLAVRGLLGAKSFYDNFSDINGSKIGVNEYIVVYDRSKGGFFVYSVYDILHKINKNQEAYQKITSADKEYVPKQAGGKNSWFTINNKRYLDPKNATLAFLAHASLAKITGKIDYTAFD